ncbi:transmembrane protein 51b [Anoplopoma fimbria]|uniref:transmembrane protein 51b n=1 Tax=Anoplopoma fimbria TaxID=229290 RepID=UPI0023EB3502|nr:transmembrane protein 51b [Anoplopoma fimbria]XP_054473287.1 transmembrane protein 51b [Anoplopoma fimbria]
MCSSRGLCGDNNRPNRSSSSEGTGSGAHYALCALGVGLIALGIVMIVWTVIPTDGEDSGGSPTPPSNTTGGPDGDGEDKGSSKPSVVAMVLVGVGACMLLLSIFLGVRSKKRQSNARRHPVATGVPLMNHVARAPEEAAADRASYNVPSYEEVVGSGDYPVRESNLRNSTSQLPSYEDIIAAVENEGAEPTNNPPEVTPAPAEPAAELQADPPGLTSNPSLPTRSTSRASRLLRPLRVRRIKSDKLHLKDFRLQIRTPTQNPVTIEPITPPPQYDNKMPELG